jgi:uncharacterized membrane protein
VDSGLWIVDRKDQIVKWYAIVPAMFAVVAIAVPWFMTQIPEIAFALQHGFALVCHQQPERSFYLFGGSVAVCARCLGIYFGATIGLGINTSRKLAMRLLLAAVAVSLVEHLAELTRLHGNWMFVRFGLGLALGASAAMLVIARVDEVKIPTKQRRLEWASDDGDEF